MVEKNINIRFIAKEAGVSVATISRYFNNYKAMKTSTKLRIKKVCEKYNYEPSKIAGAITTRKSKTIALIIPGFREPVFMDFVMGVEKVAFDNGYCVNIFSTRQEIDKEKEIIKIINNRIIDGVIFSGVYGNEKDLPFVQELKAKKIPCIMADRIIPDDSVVTVTGGDYLGGGLAAEFLLQNKHKNIGVISYDLKSYIFNQRVNGFLDVLKKNNLKVNFIIEVGLKFLNIKDYIIKNINEIINSKVSAIFVTSDSIAMFCMKYLNENNLKIPRDISIIGYDDIIYSDLLIPRLTTIHHDMYRIGELAAENLINKLSNGFFKRKKIVVEPKLIIRDSVKSL